MNKISRMKELIEIIAKANAAYYQNACEIMSNKEYDALYDELVGLEKDTGVIYQFSPTQTVGYEVISKLPKESHASPMLSLDKTKDPAILQDFLNSKEGILSWKLDGLTVVLTYRGGKLFKAVTRGNGTVGEVITNNARTFVNLPLQIPYKGELVLRGEAVIKYTDFEQINATIENENDKYKNPRNLCSGSVRQLDSSITAQRKVHFLCFALVNVAEEISTISERFNWLQSQGFECVEHTLVNSDTLSETIEAYTVKVHGYDVPVDGLVLTFNDYDYGQSLGATSKFPRHSMAFKWQDATATTILTDVEWNTSRTGLVNPVAIFEPVELEGTTVSRATLNNVSIIRDLELGIGDEISVYKANMIIPTIDDNLTRSNTLQIPGVCPVCGAPTIIKHSKDSSMLYCTGKDCAAKTLKLFVNFVKRDAMNIDGLSESTLDKLISKGWLVNFVDLYTLQERHGNDILTLERFGKKKMENLFSSIEKSRNVDLAKFIVALGIPNVGRTQSKLLAQNAKTWDGFISQLGDYDFTNIEGIGPVINSSLYYWYENLYTQTRIEELASYMIFTETIEASGEKFKGMNICITGSLQLFANRNALKEYIENEGGKVVSSVTAATSMLINNDVDSNSSKNKKAKELGIPIVSENKMFH